MRYRASPARWDRAAKTALLVAATAVALFLAVAAVVFTSFFGVFDGSHRVKPKSNFTVDEAQAFRDFPVFYVGDRSPNGFPLSAIRYDSLGPSRQGRFSVEFYYGDCELPRGIDAGGCTLPVSISNEPACARPLALSGPIYPEHRRTTVRGVPAVFFEGGSRLEIRTGTSAVVIYAYSRREALAVAKHLRGLNVATSVQDPLPPPAPGALEGSLKCAHR